jgi:uncharacterized protein involved in copper resistance
LAPNFFEFEPTFYFSDGGRVAGRVNSSYDLLITQRPILQPQFELNFYSKSDPSRGTGSGLSELDTGLRLRYEISRKLGLTSVWHTAGNSVRRQILLARKGESSTMCALCSGRGALAGDRQS